MLRSANLPNFLSWISKSVKLGGEMSRVLGMNETVSPGIRKLVVSWKVSMRMLTFQIWRHSRQSPPSATHTSTPLNMTCLKLKKTCQQSWSLERPPAILCWALRDDRHMTESERKHWLRPSANYLLRNNIPGRKSQEWGSLRLTGRLAWSCWHSTEQRYKPLQLQMMAATVKNSQTAKGLRFFLVAVTDFKEESISIALQFSHDSQHSSIILISHWFLKSSIFPPGALLP